MSLFSLFGLEKQKKRKRKLVAILWCDHRLADASAQVVLSVFRDHMEARHAWVENKRDARVRADLLCTVQVRVGVGVMSRSCVFLFVCCWALWCLDSSLFLVSCILREFCFRSLGVFGVCC